MSDEILHQYYCQKYKTDKLEIIEISKQHAFILMTMGYHKVELVK